MSAFSTSRNRTSSVAHTEYRAQHLGENGIVFLDHFAFRENLFLRRFEQVERCLVTLLRSSLDQSVIMSSGQLDALDKLGDIVAYQENGYKTSAVIGKAIDLRGSARTLENAAENEWITLFITEVWDFFQMKTSFAYSQDALWHRYDPAIMQLVPSRANLVKPKPDFAFGLHYQMRSSMYNKLRSWKDKSIPAVDTFVTPYLAMPFLIFESKSNDGSLRTAENQLANSLIKAHDILCSLNLQDELYVLGVVQVQFILYFYISFSTRQVDEDGKAFTDMIYLVKLDKCFLDDFQGCLKCLKFVEWAKTYGLSTFRNTIESAMQRL